MYIYIYIQFIYIYIPHVCDVFSCLSQTKTPPVPEGLQGLVGSPQVELQQRLPGDEGQPKWCLWRRSFKEKRVVFRFRNVCRFNKNFDVDHSE